MGKHQACKLEAGADDSAIWSRLTYSSDIVREHPALHAAMHAMPGLSSTETY
jgi:hypothetical protein